MPTRSLDIELAALRAVRKHRMLTALKAAPSAKAELREITYNGVTVRASDRRSADAETKKYERTVIVDGNERTVSYGDPDMEMQRDNPEARENFLSRHNCSEKTDPSAPGFWACYDWERTSEKAAKSDDDPVPDDVANPKPQKSAAGYAVVDATADEGDALYQRVYERVLADTGDPVKARLAALGMTRRKRLGLAVKSTKAGYVVAGWAIMFGDPLLRDLDQTYFANKDTDLALDYYGIGAPLWYEHGVTREYGVDVIGERTMQQVFEHGVWLEHVLYDDHRLYENTRDQVENGMLTYSSDSIAHIVNRRFSEDDGALLAWPLVGCSLTKSPAEPGLGAVIPVSAEAATEDG